MKYCRFFVQLSHMAALFERYDIAKGRKVRVGVDDIYGPIDPESGASYKALGNPSEKGNGMIFYSGDLTVGLFYPEQVFIYGHGERQSEGLTFEQVEAFKAAMWDRGTSRVLLPKGYVKGQWTWDQGVMYSPVENKPQWYGIEKMLASKFPGSDVYRYRGCNWVEVGFDDPSFDGGKFTYQPRTPHNTDEPDVTSASGTGPAEHAGSQE